MKEVSVVETSSASAQTYMQIQSDWSDADESCWLDVYDRSVKIAASNDRTCAPVAEVQSSLSSQYQLPLANESTSLQAQSCARICSRGSLWIDVQVEKAPCTQLRTVFQAPTETVKIPVTASESVGTPFLQLHTVDVSRDERFVVVGGTDGVCMLWDRQDRTHMLPLKGHVADVTKARFFPSSQVVLTGSLDLTLKIWSIQGKCAAELKGHRGGIEDVVIIGRGKNVLSCGNDGLIQLWNCGTQDVIAKWANDDQSPVHCLSLLNDTAQLLVDGKSQPCTSEIEAETDGKVFFAGLENGETLGVDLRAQRAVLNLDGLAGSILSCATISTMLFTGSEDGLLTVWDLRYPESPLHVLSRSSTPIHSIAASMLSTDDQVCIYTAHGDGACTKWSTFGQAPHVATEYTGPHYDAVREVAVGAQTGLVVSACRDGCLREYAPRKVTTHSCMTAHGKTYNRVEQAKYQET